MKTLLIAAASVSTLLGAGAAMAQPYHNDWDHGSDRAWHDRDHNDRRWDRRWRDERRWDHRWDHRYHYGAGYYGHRVCSWRYGEQVCWYQR